jgi:ubiquinone/menaquinone biosynthesis C-methylase UbiE
MNMRGICFKFYWKVKKVIASDLKYSQTIYEEVLRQHVANMCYWLDIGCGHQLLPRWRLDQERELVQQAKVVIGLDYDIASLKKHRIICHRIQGDILRLPFANSSFNLLTSNMVFEHLKEPRIQLKEVSRILKPGGILILHTPNVLGYNTLMARFIPEFIKSRVIQALQDRKEEDVFPTYYRLNSTRAIENAAAFAGLEIRSIRLIVSEPVFIMIPPLVILELIFIRLLMSKFLKPFRTSIIATLQKPRMSN